MKRSVLPALRDGLMLAACVACGPRRPDGGVGRDRPPNVVFLYADDLGYGDLGCYGAEKIKTPNLDRMAAEGLRFTSFYSCAPSCTPSRVGLLTGRYPIRTGLSRVLFPSARQGLEDSEVTLAEALRARGYATACVGKWHLGHLPAFLPTRHGFDRYFGIPYSNDMDLPQRKEPPTPLLRDEKVVEQPAELGTLTRRYTEEAIRFISDSRGKPFFLYLPYTMPHVPLAASERFKGRSAGGLYGDVVEELDGSVGEILAALRRFDVDANTLVVFSSDNGPWLSQKERGGSAGKLRNGKGTTFEGGVREPCIARWPGRIRAGRVEDSPAIMLDWLPTLARLAGGTAPADRVIDGRDIRDVLFETGRRSDEEFFFYHREELLSHRSGSWKLMRSNPGPLPGHSQGHPLMLFNLEEDPCETTSLADRHPDIAGRLEAEMEAFEKSLGTVPPTKN